MSSHYRGSPYVDRPEPELEKNKKGEEDYPQQFRQFGAETITLEDIVSAVLPNNKFVGDVEEVHENKKGTPVSISAAAKKWNNAFSASVMSAEDQLEDALKIYGVQLATIPHWVESKRGELRSSNPVRASQFPPLTGHRRNVRNGEENLMACYYCKRCLDLRGFENGNPDGVRLALVVVGRIRKVNTGTFKKAQATLTVEKLFPHDRQCLEGNTDMTPSRFLDQARFGSGALLVDFPMNDIVGKTMARMVDLFKANPHNNGGVPVGEQIFPNSAESGVKKGDKYMFDHRFYMRLPSEEEFIRKVLSPTDFRMMMIAVWYWIAGKFSVSSQMYELQLKRFSVGAGNHLYPTWPCVDLESIHVHLFLSDVSGLWGGHQKGNHVKPVDQVLHIDIPEKRVETNPGSSEEEQLCGVTANPDLQGRMRPGSCMVPLMDQFRELCIVRDAQKFVERVSAGQMLYFAGDFCHGGKTYPKTDTSHHLCLHFYLNSIFHEKVDDNIGLVTEANALHGQEHARYLDASKIDEMTTILKEAQKKLDHAVKLNKDYIKETKKQGRKRKQAP